MPAINPTPAPGMRWLYLVLLLITACSSEESNLALGTLERDRIVLTATANEIVTRLPVEEGASVEAGQLLVQLDPTKQALVIDNLQAELKAHETVLQRLRNGPRAEEIRAARAHVAFAEARLTESRQQLTRIEQLVQQNASAPSELDTAVATTASNEANLQDANAQLELLLAGTRPEEIVEAEARLQGIRARLALEQRKLEELSVIATRSGTLDTLPYHLGERVAVGTPIAVLLSGPSYARVHIPESRRAAIDIGSELGVYVDGADRRFTGTVRWISKDPEFTPYYALNSLERSRLVYRAEVELSSEASDLPAGLPAQVELPR